MQNQEASAKTYQESISLWVVLPFVIFAMITINAVIVLGLAPMSNALLNAAVAMAFASIVFSTLFSIMQLRALSVTSPVAK